jgi:hypothetical protein
MLVFDVELLGFDKAPEPPEDVAEAPKSAKKTKSGLAYRVLKKGKGNKHPKASDTVVVHYTGWTTNGKMFDSSVMRGQPAEFPLGGVIPGWTEGVQLMVPGEKARFCSPGRSPTATSPPSPAPPRARWRSTSSCSRSSKSCADLPTGKFAARKPRAR